MQLLLPGWNAFGMFPYDPPHNHKHLLREMEGRAEQSINTVAKDLLKSLQGWELKGTLQQRNHITPVSQGR